MADVVAVLQQITRGRLVSSGSQNPYIVPKSSGVWGKGIMETPGLVWGDLEAKVHKLGVVMTLNEAVVELAHSLGINVLVVHHPIAEAASTGGVTFVHYLSLYDLHVLELHEAFHGLHPGIPFLHGHEVIEVIPHFARQHGRVVFIGKALPSITKVEDVFARLNYFMGHTMDQAVLNYEQELRGQFDLWESGLANAPVLLSGQMSHKMGHVIHFFPHTGFSTLDLKECLLMYPDTDTLIMSISRLPKEHALISLAQENALNLIAGNTHALEVFENGYPLGYALLRQFPSVPHFLLRDWVTAQVITADPRTRLEQYGYKMAKEYLGPFAEN